VPEQGESYANKQDVRWGGKPLVAGYPPNRFVRQTKTLRYAPLCSGVAALRIDPRSYYPTIKRISAVIAHSQIVVEGPHP
jgi:hypothetical protein